MSTSSDAPRGRPRNPVVDLVINLSTANAFLKGKLDEACSPFGLTGAQYNLLRVLHHSGRPEMSHSDLVHAIVEKSVDVTRSVNNMIRLGFVTRRAGDDDRRVALHAITQSGRDVLREIDERFRTLMTAINDAFTADELHGFSHLCERLSAVDVPRLDGTREGSTDHPASQQPPTTRSGRRA